MADGSLKEIQDVKIGDLVRTKDGVEQVINVWDPETLEEGTPECYEIEFEDGSKVVCSDKHKFMVDGQWIEAKNLQTGVDVGVV